MKAFAGWEYPTEQQQQLHVCLGQVRRGGVKGVIWHYLVDVMPQGYLHYDVLPAVYRQCSIACTPCKSNLTITPRPSDLYWLLVHPPPPRQDQGPPTRSEEGAVHVWLRA
jgi:hypothetical protein